MNPRVKKVKVEPNYHLRLTFENGQERLFDVKPYLSTGIFQKLKEPKSFQTARVAYGSVQWKGGQDLCPDTLYEESVPTVKAHSVVLVHEEQAFYKAASKKVRK